MKRILLSVLIICAIANIAVAYPSWSSWASATKAGVTATWTVNLRTPIDFIQDAKALFEIQVISDRSTFVDHVDIKFIEDDLIDDNDYDQTTSFQNFISGTFINSQLVTTGTISEVDDIEEMFAKVRIYYTSLTYTEVETPKINITRYGDDSYEDNDTYSSAYTLALNGAYGNLIFADAGDWYKYTIPSNTYHYIFTLDDFYNSVGDLDLELYYPNGTTLVDYSRSTSNTEVVSGWFAGGTTVYIRVYPKTSGNRGWYDIRSAQTTGVEGEPLESKPQAEFSIRNYPNPVKTGCTIEYTVGEPTHVNIKLYNITGQLLSTLLDQYSDAGKHAITWSGRSETGTKLAPGVYILRMEYQGKSVTKRLTMIK